MEIGTNLPPQLLTPDQARAVVPQGAWLRFVATAGQAARADSLAAAGFKRLLVLTRDSLIHQPADRWAILYPGVDAVQVINEPDAVPGSPSSDVMTQGELLNALEAVSDAFGPDMTIVGPGLCSGDPNWWNSILSMSVNAIAVHPYGKSPREAADLLEAYWNRWQQPIWITEYVDPDHSAGGELSGLQDAFRALPFVTTAINYGLSPAWANGFGGHMPEFRFGILQWMKNHPDMDCGQPLEEEFYYAEGHSQQMTTTGMFFYAGGDANAVQFVGRPK